jgi:hypothetical protein
VRSRHARDLDEEHCAKSVLVAALLFWFGEPMRDFIEHYLNLVTAFLVLMIGGFVAIKYLF